GFAPASLGPRILEFRFSETSLNAHFCRRGRVIPGRRFDIWDTQSYRGTRPRRSDLPRRRFSNMDAVDDRCVLSIDVEDWFHILDLPSTPSLVDWDRLPSRVERNFLRLLDLAAEHRVRCTCFFLG